MSISTTKRSIIKAVRELNSRLTVADVIASTGLSHAEITTELNNLAAETGTTLEVTKAGDVFYCFPANFAYAYFAHGFRRAVYGAVLQVCRSLIYCLKLSFGIILVGSMILIWTIILLFQTAVASWFGTTDQVGKIWSDFFQVLRVCIFQNLILFNRKERSLTKEQGFLLNCFSFLFGDGNPNEHLQEQRWKLIAQVIRLNEGIVVAEHLSPYTGKSADDLSSVFSILAKYSGIAKLTESGHLAYVFPSMCGRSTNSNYAFMPSSVAESRMQFSHLRKQQIVPVISMVLCNFIGGLAIYWFLYKHVGHNGAAQLPFWVTGLAVYGTLFVVFPMVRLLFNFGLNKRIDDRNAAVKGFELALHEPDAELRLKLEEAEAIRLQNYALTDRNAVVYRTDKDYLEQLAEKLEQA